MWIRNKGTPEKPNWQLVESCRMEGKKHPHQKIICQMGRHNNFKDLIQLWETLAHDARTANRHHMSVDRRNKKYPILKKYARGLSLKEINAKLSNIRECEWRFNHHIKSKFLHEEIIKSKPESEYHISDPGKSQAVNRALYQLEWLIQSAQRDLAIKKWNPYFRENFRKRVKELYDFSNTV